MSIIEVPASIAMQTVPVTAVPSYPIRLRIAGYLRAHALLWLIILGIGAYRSALIPVGQDYFPDEARQHNSENMLDFMVHGDWAGAAWWLFSTQGRPGAVLIGLIPAAIQRWTGASAVVVSQFNMVVSLVIVWLVYRILLTFAERWQAVAGTALFTLIHANSLYIRHLLPYDWALAFFLLACWIGLRRKPMRLSMRQVALIGVLCGFGFSVYPGYYPLLGIIGLLIMLFNRRHGATFLVFATGVIAVQVIYVLLSPVARLSYVDLLRAFASTINQGDYTDSYYFAAAYLVDSEGVFGATLLALFGVSALLAIKRRDWDARVRGLVILSLLAYLAYATLVFVFHAAVYYGRLIHAYIPFILIGSVLALTALPPRYTRLVWGGMLALGAASLIVNAAAYLPLQYPNTVRTRLFADYPGLKTCELITNIDWKLDVTGGCDVMGVNVRFLWPGMDTHMIFEPPPNWEALYLTNHPANYWPYQYEGYTRQERDAIRQRPHQLAIYRINR
ncbi:MAG: hypothetical protein IT324_07815 [Anaerolineae bacterium]|nr:hypothetical protein [Anaerolineae bacterium]